MEKLRKTLPFFLSFAVVALLGVGFAEAQQTPDAPGRAGDSCQVRVTVADSEAQELTGDPNATGHEGGTVIGLTGDDAADNALICTYALIVWISWILFVILLVVAVIFILVAAFLFVTGGGDEGKNQQARKYLIYGIVGIVVAALAFVVPNIARTILAT